MIQKFRHYQFVHVKSGYSSMTFALDGIIHGSYSDLFGGKCVDKYSIFKLEDDVVVDCMAWFDEWQVSLSPEQDIDRAAQLIENYNFKE